MDKLFNNRWFLRFVSLVIATMLFLMVNMDDMGNQPGVFPAANSEQLTVEDEQLEVYYDDDQYAIVEMEDTVDLQLSGTQSALNLFQVTDPNYEVYVDLEGLGPGVHNVNVEYSDFPAGINITPEPESVQVTLEERETVSLPVEVEFMNEGAMDEGYTIGEPEVTPSEVDVQGPPSQLEDIDALQAYIDVGEAEATIEESVEVSVYGPYGEVLDLAAEPGTVDVIIPITPPSAEVPVEVLTEGTVDEDLEIVSLSSNPENVTIYGDLANIENIEAVETEPIDLSALTESESFDLDVTMPEGVDQVQPETINVNAEVEDEEDGEEATQTLEVPLEVDNVPDDVEVSVPDVTDDEEFDVTVQGNEEEMDDFNEEDVRLYIDYEELDEELADEEPDEIENVDDAEDAPYELPVHVEGPDGFMYQPENESLEVEITNPETDE
ncbi:CdaR family protein [Natribacillus halophilus]|uniref:YbbR domain-containing protein n=1 Tax=Natribacillus halophilus TaxID=549003 RepID=A0A1G8S3X9_9BACI|nr:CdaR family protein [Natribacillus halophilus]SDJ23852.1 YbbR domain-containing protein [Natribacillus halophilus]